MIEILKRAYRSLSWGDTTRSTIKYCSTFPSRYYEANIKANQAISCFNAFRCTAFFFGPQVK